MPDEGAHEQPAEAAPTAAHRSLPTGEPFLGGQPFYEPILVTTHRPEAHRDLPDSPPASRPPSPAGNSQGAPHHASGTMQPRPPPGRWGRVDGPLGPPEYRHMPVRFHRPPGGTMENGMRYEYSDMTGRRKALLIGINYVGSKAELKGCWNDVANIRRFIMTAGFRAEDMVILTDQTSNPRGRPTRANMTAAMHWLVKGAKPGDSLFFHYSGHGSQVKAADGDEGPSCPVRRRDVLTPVLQRDGLNECIVPLDYLSKGLMDDDELHELIVKPLPVGCRLTALFDSCHSGTVLDLPYVYASSGKVLESDVAANMSSKLQKALQLYAQGHIKDAQADIKETVAQAKQAKTAQEITIQTRSSGANVIMFSGCKDSQTSADTYEAHKATGALSFAWIRVFAKYPNITYLQLINALRDELVKNYTQKPQMSSSHPWDLNILFVI